MSNAFYDSIDDFKQQVNCDVVNCNNKIENNTYYSKDFPICDKCMKSMTDCDWPSQGIPAKGDSLS